MSDIRARIRVLVLDSFATLSLASFTENQLNVQLEDSDLQSGRLFSLSGIESFVRSRTGNRHECPGIARQPTLFLLARTVSAPQGIGPPESSSPGRH